MDVDEFRIAAGLVLLVYAVASIMEVPLGFREDVEEAAIFPIATPLLAGPGAIAAIIHVKYTSGLAVAIAATMINMAVAYLILSRSLTLVDKLGRHGALLIDKFMSLVMAGSAVSIIVEGLRGIGVVP